MKKFFIFTTLLLSLLTFSTSQAKESPISFNRGFQMNGGWLQGMDTWDNYLVSLRNYGWCDLYRIDGLNSGTRLGYFKLGSFDDNATTLNHCNSASFSSQFYADGDKLPLLYVCRCNASPDADGMVSVCYVERIDVDNAKSTLVQKIYYQEAENYITMYAIDRQNNALYCFGNSQGQNGGEGNKHFVYKFKIPEVGEGKPDKVYLTKSDALESYYIEDTYSGQFNDVLQGGAVYNDILYMPCGYGTSHSPSGEISMLYLWDLKNRKMVKELNLDGIFSEELEDISVNYPGWLVLQAIDNHIYFMSKEEDITKWDDLITFRGVLYRITDREARTAEAIDIVTEAAGMNLPGMVFDGTTPYTVTALSDSLFAGNTTLTSVTLPPSLKTLGHGTFDGCNNLKTVVSRLRNPDDCDLETAFTDAQKGVISLYYPRGCADTYRTATGWNAFAKLEEADNLVLDVAFHGGNIVRQKGGATNAVGKMGQSIVQYSPDRKLYFGSTKLNTTDNNTDTYNGNSVFYVKYDGNDNVGLALTNQFTLEAVFRLDKTAGAAYNSSTSSWSHADLIKIISSQQGGGLCLKQSATERTRNSNGTSHLNGLSTEFIRHRLYSTNPLGAYNNVSSGYFLKTGVFYHVAVTYDRETNTETIYVNGEPKVTQKLGGTGELMFPDCGTTRRDKGMFFILGGDARSENTPTSAEFPCAVTFKSFKIYNEAFPADQIAGLYNTDEVKQLTEPVIRQRLLDVQFGKDGAFSDASPYATLVKNKSTAVITTELNAAQQRYEMVCKGDAKTFLRRPYYYDAAFTKAFSRGYSLEVYAKVPDGDRTASISPFGGEQASGGPTFEILKTGVVKFRANAFGCSGPTQYSYSQGKGNLTASGKFKTGEYIHYVAVFDPNPDTMKVRNGRVSLYINGQLASTRTFNGTEMSDLPVANWQWFCVGGNTNSNNGVASCQYPWTGNIAIARLWSQPLSADDVTLLNEQAVNPASTTVTIPASGYAAACLPYTAVVPEGLTAYVISDETTSTVTLKPVATAGQAMPYATPVILHGNAGVYHPEAVPSDDATVVNLPDTNRLEGNLASLDVAAGQVYALATDATGQPVMQLIEADSLLTADLSYLPYTTQGDRIKTFRVEEPEGINAVRTTEDKQGRRYDLLGRPASEGQRGIIISDGKKQLQK